MKLLLSLVCVASADVVLESNYEDFWPSKIDNVCRMLQTTEERPEAQELKVYGRIPPWMQGSFYKNGPGIYEWGDTKYEHFFDPNGILTRYQINGADFSGDGQQSIKYHSKYIESTNFHQNKAANKIVNPEVGTYGEADYITTNDDGTPITDEREVKRRRMEYIIDHYPTSNSLVSVVPFHGWLLSMNESPIVHLHDPVTLEAVHEIDFRQAAAFKDIKIMTFTAHGMYDKDGAFWNTAIGVDLRDTIPRVGVFIVKMPGAGRPKSDPFQNQSTVEEIVESMIVSDPIFTSNNPLDLDIPYFHMFSMTDNYIVLPFTSVYLSATTVLGEMLEARPLVTAMEYRPDTPTTYHMFNKNTFKLESRHFSTDPGVCVHTINAYELENGDIRLDTALAGNGDIFNMYGYENINSTGVEYMELFESVLPVGKAVTYNFEMNANPGPLNKPIYTKEVEVFPPEDEVDDKWKGMLTGGVEFPIIDFYNKAGQYYEHYWANGFGSFMPDRVYHVNVETKERWIYSVDGYSPSEPAFAKNPYSEDEDDGIVIVVMSPLSDYSLRPFIVLLDGRTLTYRAHAWLPEGHTAPVGFHGMWVNHPPMF